MSSRKWLHLKLNKCSLECLGIEPHQLNTTKRRNYFVFAAFNLSLVLPLIQGVAEKLTWSVMLYYVTIACTVYLVGGLYLATIMYVKPQRLAKLYEQIETDLSGITCEEELAIMNEFSRQAKSLTFCFIGMAILAVSMFIAFNFLPLLYPSAQAYSAIFSVYSNRWIIHESLCRWQIIVHVSMVGSYTALVYLAIVSVYISSIKHACGMYTIVSYRLRKVTRSINEKTENEAIPQLLDVVAKHREAIESVRVIKEAFGRTSYTIQNGALICFAVVIFVLRLSFTIQSTYSLTRVIAMGPVAIVYVFYLNYGGEQIIEFSNSIFTTTYLVNWHLMSVEARTILLMIILRSSKSDTLNGGTMTLSLQNFAKIMYVSWSIAAVLLSVEC